jgi:membrane protein implicated in regulation of membrane protease activity
MLDTIFLISAVVGGTIMVCQFLLMCVGMGDDGSGDIGGDADVGDFGADAEIGADGIDVADADHHTTWHQAGDADVGHPDASRIFEILSFRSVIAAVAFFGFAGKAALASGTTETKALLIGLAAGATALYSVYWLMVQIYKLRTSGNENIQNALGKQASVYVAIPSQGNGMGKVQLAMQNRIVEYQAVSEQEATLKSGGQVVVVKILGPDKVLVEPASEMAESTA